MEKYAVVSTTDKGTASVVFNKRSDALEHAVGVRMTGIEAVELFKSEGLVQLRPEVVKPAPVNGNGASRPARKAAPAPAKAPKKKKAKKKASAKKAAPRKTGFPSRCIAPDCRKKNRGPRFSFLCVDHIGTKKKTVEKWKADAKK